MRFATILCALLAATASATELPKLAAPIKTVEELWAGFDPRATPLDVEVVKAWDEGDVHLEMVYFTGEVFEGTKTRIFGYFGRPKKAAGKVPGILHVHGGGQTAVLDWPRFWAKRGFVCLSFDFCGNTKPASQAASTSPTFVGFIRNAACTSPLPTRARASAVRCV